MKNQEISFNKIDNISGFLLLSQNKIIFIKSFETV